MPRSARRMSESGYFHVIERGNGNQLIFECDDDRRLFIGLLEKYSREVGVSVCAYCLMDNHVHLLLHDGANQLPVFMKKLNVSYARSFNWKYERSGHLFQDRYKSEPIEDDPYFLSVLRYILRNPTKAGLCSPENYPWSSFRMYDGQSFVDTTFIRELFPDIEAYEEYILSGPDVSDAGLEMSSKSDAWARKVLSERIGVESGAAIQSFDRARRDAAVCELLKAGLSERQISRLTGISRHIIHEIAW